MTSIRSIRLLGLAVVAAVIPACLSNNPSQGVPQPPPANVNEFKVVRLSGGQEVPKSNTTATGNATVTISPDRTSITVTLEVFGLTNITAAHIHDALVGVDGPIMFSLAASSFVPPLTVTLTKADLILVPGISSFDQALSEIASGRTYINVHTAAFPDGEIRGQVGPAEMNATLTSSQEVRTVTTLATGTMGLQFSNDQSTITIGLQVFGITNVTAARIHAGPPGQDGPIIFSLAENSFQVPLQVSLTSANFTPQSSAGINTFEDAVDAILSGNTYVNVPTTINPDGEIRGQILP